MKYLKVFTSFGEIAEGLSDGALARLFRAMLKYALDGTEPQMRSSERALWTVVRQGIDREAEAYENKVEASREAGRKSGEARRKRSQLLEPNERNRTNMNKTNQDKEEEEEKDEYKEEEKESVCRAAAPRALIGPPSLEEVTSYCEERGNRVNPQRFMDFYTANGWRVGKNPMRDWKAAVRSWESNGMDQRQEAPRKKSSLDSFKEAMALISLEEAKKI